MAKRPVYIVSQSGAPFIRDELEFTYYGGFADSQKQKCVDSLHDAYKLKYGDQQIMEVSSKSKIPLGVNLSAFNLKVKTKSHEEYAVEVLFQSSKVFEKGGPYHDILHMSPRDAKRDERLRNSGDVIGFKLGKRNFPTEPKTYFYNWLYINALHKNKDLAREVLNYNAFTDINFNPKKSINCQAEAVAVYVSLSRRNTLLKALKSQEDFLEEVYLIKG